MRSAKVIKSDNSAVILGQVVIPFKLEDGYEAACMCLPFHPNDKPTERVCFFKPEDLDFNFTPENEVS